MRSLTLSFAALSLLAIGPGATANALCSSVDTLAAAQIANARSDSIRKPWVTRRDVEHVGFALAASAALGTVDRTISREFFEPHWLGSGPVQHTAANIAFFGGRGPFLISGLLYASGTALHAPGLSQAALHNVEAIALSAAVTGLGKGLTGRALPGVSTTRAFSFGRGFHTNNGPFVSFPSGHTAAAFAMATTIDDEIALVRPDIAATAQPWLLVGATAVGMARVVQRAHWPSDVPLAVVIGMWSGHTVETHTAHGGVVAAALRGLSMSPARAGGATFGWSSRVSAESLSGP